MKRLVIGLLCILMVTGCRSSKSTYQDDKDLEQSELSDPAFTQIMTGTYRFLDVAEYIVYFSDKDLTDLKLDLERCGLPVQVFTQISCLAAAYNFLNDTELSNEEFQEKFQFDLSDVNEWEYDECIPWEEIEEKVDLSFTYINYLVGIDREKLLTENIGQKNIMMLRLNSYKDDYNYIYNVEFRRESHWIIWNRYEGESYHFMPYFISPLLPDCHSAKDIADLNDLQYVATSDMVIISRKGIAE